MKKIRIALAVSAFALASGLAYASNASSVTLTACKAPHSDRFAEGCQNNSQVICCVDAQNNTYFGDYVNP